MLFPPPLCLRANTGASRCGLPSFLGNFSFNGINLSKFSLNFFYKELGTNHLIFLHSLAIMSNFFKCLVCLFLSEAGATTKNIYLVSHYC